MQCHVCQNEYIKRGIVFKCSSCGHAFREFDGDPIKFHKHEYRKTFRRDKQEIVDGQVVGVFHSARQAIVDQRLALIQKYLHPSASCLDIGAGGGTFAKNISPHVKSVECTELDRSLLAEIDRLGFRAYSGDFLDIEFGQQYDVAFAWHVLEHVPDIKAFVSGMSALAEYCIIEVPTQRRVHKKFDGHYHLFSEESLKRLVRNCGLSIVEVGPGIQSPAIFIVAKKET